MMAHLQSTTPGINSNPSSLAPCDRFSRLGRSISIWTTPSDGKSPKRTRRKFSFAFSCLIPLSLARPAILLLRRSFSGIRIYFFGIPTQTEDQQLSRTPTPGLRVETSCVINGPFCQETAFAGLLKPCL